MRLEKLLGLAALVCGVVGIIMVFAVHQPKVAIAFAAIGVACAGGAEVIR